MYDILLTNIIKVSYNYNGILLIYQINFKHRRKGKVVPPQGIKEY